MKTQKLKDIAKLFDGELFIDILDDTEVKIADLLVSNGYLIYDVETGLYVLPENYYGVD